MEPDAIADVITALQEWVDKHPVPDRAALTVPGLGDFTPSQILSEIRDRTEAGTLFLEVIEHAAQKRGLPAVLASFRNEFLTTSAAAYGD